MSNPIKLTINRQTKALVSPPSIPDLFQNNEQDFQIQFVDPSSSLANPFTVVDMAGIPIRMWLGPTPTGTPGGPAGAAIQDTWTWDAVNKWFTATLELNVAAIDTLIGTGSSAQAFLEITQSAPSRITHLQTTVTVKAVGDEGSAVAPNPVDQYLTKAQSLALFARLQGATGQRIVLQSPSGTHSRELGVNDDGSGVDNLI